MDTVLEGADQAHGEAVEFRYALIEQVRCEITDLKQDIIGQLRSEVANLGHALIELRREVLGQIRAEAADLRQIGHFAARKAWQPGHRIRCVFLVHAIESWDAQIDLWEAMRRDDRFAPLVVSINRRFPGDATFRGENETSAALDRAGVPHIRLGMQQSFAGLDILRALQPDVIFRQSQWEPDVPPAFATDRLTFARICSVPYGMSIVGQFEANEKRHEGVSAHSFDQLWHRMAWRVFCETEQSQQYFVNFRHSDPAKFVVSGYPKLRRLLRARDEAEVWPVQSAEGRRFRVIWAPHYSVGTEWLGFGVFGNIYQDFLAFACACSDIDFILKPHPALFASVVGKGVVSKQELEDFLKQWCSLPNCALETGTYAHLFAASDMMVTDGLSFLTEYQIFDKPLVYFDSGCHVPFNALGDAAVASSHVVRTFQDMAVAIEHYAQGGDWSFDAERRNLLAVLFPREREAVDIILDSIAEGFAGNQQEVSQAARVQKEPL